MNEKEKRASRGVPTFEKKLFYVMNIPINNFNLKHKTINFNSFLILKLLKISQTFKILLNAKKVFKLH